MPFIPENRHYDKAPIKEALIGLGIDRPSSSTLAGLAKLDFSARGYSGPKNIYRTQFEGRIEGDQATAKADHGQVGYQFIGEDGRHVARIDLEGFAFSRLVPYDSWEQLREEARAVWNSYRSVVPGRAVTRVGLRYINQIDMPQPVRDFRDYIRTYPEISSDLPQAVASFFFQVQVPLEPSGVFLNLTQALVPPSAPNVTSVVLDIDVVRKGIRLESDDEIWRILDELRLQKNLIFESCITNRTRELIS
jgi:uncharacterized protein (TIGR04255 family)